MFLLKPMEQECRECVGKNEQLLWKKMTLSVFLQWYFPIYSVLVLTINDSLTNKDAVVCEVNCFRTPSRRESFWDFLLLLPFSKLFPWRLCLAPTTTRGKKKKTEEQRKQATSTHLHGASTCFLGLFYLFEKTMKKGLKANCVAAAAPLTCSRHPGGLHKEDICRLFYAGFLVVTRKKTLNFP